MDEDETPRDEQFLAVAQILAIGLLRSLNKDELARRIVLPPSLPEFLPHPDPIAEPAARTQQQPAAKPASASPTKRPRRSKHPSDDTIVDLLDPGVDQFIRQRAKQICRRQEFSRSDEDDLCQEIRLHVLSLAKPPRTKQLAYTIDQWERRYLRYLNQQVRKIWLRVVRLDDDPAARELADTFQPHDSIDRKEAFDYVLSRCTSKQRTLVRLVAAYGKAEAARELRKSRRHIDGDLQVIGWFMVAAGIISK